MARKKRKVPGLNASSTADISFILLIFFLVTTSMDTDSGLARRLPPPPEDEQNEAQIDVKERNVLMDRLADLRDAGMGLADLYHWAEENKRKVQHWFFSTDLTFYIKGGRVTKTAGFVGTMLSICPLLHVDCEGKLIPMQKVRTKKKVIDAIEKKMEELAENGLAYDGKCYISHSACQADAEAVASLVESRFPNLNGRVLINSIGTTIGSHTGPGTVALFFWGEERKS